ncbi:family 10 glycosylhydrolase [Sphingobacterium oryzagri]|uniref:Family 10 glycosylhydrolase n=1 Tax=Sphingobacterium oryzagri TaxID=3025669 RepID=A0ABY7WQ11_9SPHI|nr:family 10 glycosylhydrolase [Sphingobacterium sp. KACC 22765]WDF70812.1 family 10 glycosylhydrolase [Sphingobacterium sp. KACC 22765]
MNLRPIKSAAVMVLIMTTVLFSCASRKNKRASKALQSPAVAVVQSDNTQSDKPAAANTGAPAAVVTKAKVSEKKEPVEVPLRVELPSVSREFRGAWIATVANINWPTRGNYSTEAQKREAIQLLDFLKENNFNAVIFQVRPSGDALYESPYEPWSYFLTGETGKRPYPYYDPLTFWVEEAHKRGLELHVWLNPYRAHHSSGGTVTSESMVKKAPEMVVRLRNGMYWFDPANPKTQDHAAKVVLDIVKRYNIDGVHFDDYFYPYASYNGGADFPDDASWSVYRKSGGSLSRADWRRDNVNKFIERVYREIKAEKGFVKFGISPFGIWKPGYPAGITGSSQYDELYADAKLWLNRGWIDYFTPQLYWPIEPQRQSFTALLRWWQSENTQHRHVWPGLNTVEVRSSNRPQEIVRQIEATRQLIPNSVGAAHWSIAGLTKSPSMVQAIKEQVYQQKALIPRTPWLFANPLLAPSLLLTPETSSVFAKWLHKQPDQVFQWIAYAQYGDTWEYEILDAAQSEKSFPKVKNGKQLKAVAVKAVDRLSNESEYVAKRAI